MSRGRSTALPAWASVDERPALPPMPCPLAHLGWEVGNAGDAKADAWALSSSHVALALAASAAVSALVAAVAASTAVAVSVELVPTLLAASAAVATALAARPAPSTVRSSAASLPAVDPVGAAPSSCKYQARLIQLTKVRHLVQQPPAELVGVLRVPPAELVRSPSHDIPLSS